MKQTLTRNIAAEVLERLGGIPRQASPRWGKMNPAQMLGHLTEVFQYSMGEGQDMPFSGNLRSRFLYKHLLLYGIADFPKNVRLPNPEGAQAQPAVGDGNIEQLEAVVKQYLDRYEAHELTARIHPFFGMMSPKTWTKFHFYHTRHHMRQFGMEPSAPKQPGPNDSRLDLPKYFTDSLLHGLCSLKGIECSVVAITAAKD
jgi:hypothetical protein